MAKKIDMSRLENLTDPLMDQAVGALIGTPAKKTSVKNPNKEKKKDIPREKNISTQLVTENKQYDQIGNNKLYNYTKKEIDVEGVGVIEKVISEKGEIIGRPNKPIKEKKRPITLTLKPELYDEVKNRAASDHRTTSEYLAMIIEEYLNE